MFPSWRYHRTEPACIVQSPEADDALGEGWADTPAAFLDAAPADPDSEQAAECLSEKTKTTKTSKRK